METHILSDRETGVEEGSDEAGGSGIATWEHETSDGLQSEEFVVLQEVGAVEAGDRALEPVRKSTSAVWRRRYGEGKGGEAERRRERGGDGTEKGKGRRRNGEGKGKGEG
jgi:hypothetical protein